MEQKQWFAASFLVLTGSIIFLTLFSYTGSLMYNMWWEEDRFDPETRIASVDVSELSREEAVDLVTEEVSVWKEEAYVAFTWFDEEVRIPMEAVQVQIEPTVDRMMEHPESEGTFIININENVLRDTVDDFSFYENISDNTYTDMLAEDLSQELSDLPPGDTLISLHNYLEPVVQPEESLLFSAVRSGVVTPLMESWIRDADTVTIPAGGTFSFLETFDHALNEAVADELTLISSAAYEVLINSNFRLVERHQRHRLLDGVPLGYDAYTEPVKRDLVFENVNDYDYELHFAVSGMTLEINLYGNEYPHQIQVEIEQMEEIEPKTRVTYSNELAEGTRTTVEQGEPGYQTRTVRTFYNIVGEVHSEEIVAEDYYAPVHELEMRSIEERYEDEEEFDPDAPGFPGENGDDRGDNGFGPGNGDDWGDNGFGPGNGDDWGDNGFDPGNGNGWGGFDPGNDFDNGTGPGNGSGWSPDNGSGLPGWDENGDGFDNGNGSPGWNGNGDNGNGTGTPGWNGNGNGSWGNGSAPPGGNGGFDNGGNSWNGENVVPGGSGPGPGDDDPVKGH